MSFLCAHEEYGDSPSAQLLAQVFCLGTLDGAFTLQVPLRTDVDALVTAATTDQKQKDLLVKYVDHPFKTIQVSNSNKSQIKQLQ